jgi:hypothetical protein
MLYVHLYFVYISILRPVISAAMVFLQIITHERRSAGKATTRPNRKPLNADNRVKIEYSYLLESKRFILVKIVENNVCPKN